MSRLVQIGLLIIGALALLGVGGEIVLAVAATAHGANPVREIPVTAGTYVLTVRLYKDPADAGFALPFAIAPQQPLSGALTYSVESRPGAGVDATPVRASLSPDPAVPNGVQGAAEITVRGPWWLHIEVSGPAGPGAADVPITATAPPAIPVWSGWLIGFIPLAGLILFLLAQRPGRVSSEQ